MFIRAPHPHSLANSSAPVAFILRSRNGMRVVELGGKTVLAIWLLAAILLAWYLFATLYIVMRDDLVVSLLSGQRRAHYAYEDRIVDLRTKIEQISARQVVNQDSIEDRVSGIVARQAELEARQVMVAELGNRAASTGLALSAAPQQAIPAAPAVMPSFTEPLTTGALPFAPRLVPAKPTPLDQPLPEANTTPGKTSAPLPIRGSIPQVVKEVEKRAALVEQSQFKALETIEGTARNQVTLSRKTVAALGLDLARFGKFASAEGEMKPVRKIEPLDALMLRDVSQNNGDNSAMGGPLLPARPVQDSERFEHYFARSEQALSAAGQAKTVIESLPIGRPMGAAFDITSSFGTRVDPFTRGYALHAGIDFRAPTGTPVRTIAAGTVIEAGVSGGYGRMVEIDHGFGLTTRYAHLSAIHVEEGQRIEKGATIGLVGSTGRSTGPHLHYEVRVDEDAMDPMRFIRAARILGEAGE
jgi:murein DD-endopeptidase MepM/ murein hydrolase activator NlpD